MERSNPAYKPFYPEWKKVLWGMLRAFVGSFVPVFGTMLTMITVEHFQEKELLIKFIFSLIISSLVAGITGLGKYLRDLFPESKALSKLPF